MVRILLYCSLDPFLEPNLLNRPFSQQIDDPKMLRTWRNPFLSIPFRIGSRIPVRRILPDVE